MASEDETRKAMSDFGIKGKHLQNMIGSFATQANKDAEKKDEAAKKADRSQRYSNSPTISRRTTPSGEKRTTDTVGPDGMITKGVRP